MNVFSVKIDGHTSTHTQWCLAIHKSFLHKFFNFPLYSMQGFIQDFFLVGGKIAKCDKITACISMPKLGGLEACSPRKILKFTTSETASGGF